MCVTKWCRYVSLIFFMGFYNISIQKSRMISEMQQINQHMNSSLVYLSILRTFCSNVFVCLFGVFCPTWEFFTHIWRRHHYQWRTVNFNLCSALMAIEQWGFFSVPHLLWHGDSVYNGHLRGPVTPTPIKERFAVELSLPVFATSVCRGCDLNTQPFTRGANALTHCTTAAAQMKTASVTIKCCKT